VRADKQLKCGPLEAHHENAFKREQPLPLKMNILREPARTTDGCEKFLSSSFNIEESSVTFVNGKIECVRLWRGLLRLRELPYRGNAIHPLLLAAVLCFTGANESRGGRNWLPRCVTGIFTGGSNDCVRVRVTRGRPFLLHYQLSSEIL